MHSTPIFLLAFGLLATMAMARPGKRPWPHHGQRPDGSNKPSPGFHGQHGDKWSLYRLPRVIRLPRLLAGKVEEPRATFIAKKIFNGKYLIVSPALIFKFKNTDETSTTVIPTSSTTEQPEIETTTIDSGEELTTPEPDVEETTTEVIDEESTTPEPDVEETTTEAVEEESTTEQPDEEETTTPTPSFKKRSFSINNNEQLLFLDD
jgi:hypothetical protein